MAPDRGGLSLAVRPAPAGVRVALCAGWLALGGFAARADEPLPIAPLFNWDVVSLEQNNPRFNASVLTGFHSIRSPGVTPLGRWKLGVGLLYTREEQVAQESGLRLFRRNQLIANPKINYGVIKDVEIGAGFTASYARGRRRIAGADPPRTQAEEEVEPSSVDAGAKWNFLDAGRWRLGLSFDTKLALRRGAFGALPAHFFNFELDGDFAVTRRFSLAGNLQFLTTDSSRIRDQAIFDAAATYTFTDRFRGMLFGTVQEDDEAGTVLGFVGIAGQYAIDDHTITVSLDLQLNNAERDVRTEEQFDIEVSYTYSF